MDASRPHQFRSRRMELDVPVELRFDGSARIVDARSVNVSQTGMLVRTQVDHAPGTGFRFDVHRRYGGRGEVAWSRDAEEGEVLMGLSLLRSRDTLLDLLDDHGY